MSSNVEGKIYANKSIEEILGNYQNFISCIPSVKDIKDRKFKLDAQVDGFNVTVDGELSTFQKEGQSYIYGLKISGPGVTITITTTYKVQGNEISWSSQYKYEGFAVTMIGSLLDTTIQNMITTTNECIKAKLT
ncbi:CoxG family protein [Sulfurisphaera javensis]|uniref:CoxG family protein n=1 Tax=Sulfurisphaera javensis TaxID=2049879 RepID=A0AAT9GQY1_9CREN